MKKRGLVSGGCTKGGDDNNDDPRRVGKDSLVLKLAEWGPATKFVCEVSKDREIVEMINCVVFLFFIFLSNSICLSRSRRLNLWRSRIHFHAHILSYNPTSSCTTCLLSLHRSTHKHFIRRYSYIVINLMHIWLAMHHREKYDKSCVTTSMHTLLPPTSMVPAFRIFS